MNPFVILLLTLSTVSLFSTSVAAFENLGFEGTLLDVESLLGSQEVYNNPDVFDPNIVTPGWAYRTESLDGSVVSTPCNSDCIPPNPIHGALIDGHIGLYSQVVMSVNGRGALGNEQLSLEGRHSLYLGGDTHRGPLDSPIPVAHQTGVVPNEAKSVLIQVPGRRLPASGPAGRSSPLPSGSSRCRAACCC